MLKRLTILLLTFIAGVAGNLIAGYIQADVWQNFFTPERLLVMVVSAGLILLLLTLLESERGLAWNWPWHRLWYLRDLAANPQLRQWETDFARLKLAEGRRPIATTEVIARGQRQDMVAWLYEAFLQKQSKVHRLLILGEPGAGKTTGLERLALEFARQKVWQLGIGRPIPILLRLGNYRDGDFISFVKKEMETAVRGHSGLVLSNGLETLLAKRRVVLLCDALDEALGQQRELVLAELDRFLRSQRYGRTRVVITARTREDPGGRLPDLPLYTIQDLHDEAVRRFIRVYGRPDINEAAIYERLEKAGLLESGGLGRNPFWLRIVVESDVFQGEKGKILDKAVTTLLRREWDKPETERTGWQRILTRDEQLSESRKALAWLAYQMSAVGIVTVAQGRGQALVQSGLEQDRSLTQLRAVHVIGLGRDAQLLTYLSKKLRFRHRLLQEALTASLLAGNRALRAEAIAHYADDTGWWETFLMLGHLVVEPETLIADVLANGGGQRLFLAVGLLQGVEQPDENLRQQVMGALRQTLVKGFADEHRAAIIALAQIIRDDVVLLLVDLLLEENEPLQNGAAMLLAELGEEAMQPAMSALAQSIRRGVLAKHRIAVRALAQIVQDDVIVLLRQVFLEAESSLQASVLGLLVMLGSDAVTKALFTEEVPLQKRVAFGHFLARLGDPRRGVSADATTGLPDLVWSEEIPAGTYTIGGDEDAFLGFSEQKVIIRYPYRLARYPITQAQFQCFIDAPDWDNEEWWQGLAEKEKEFREPAWSYANHPRERVSWYQAMAFCRWLTAKLHEGNLPAESLPGNLEEYVIALPHEYEWEVAARWPNEDVQERSYSWGNEFDAARANTLEGGIGQTTAVGIYSSGKNVTLDLYDLNGNVWEWCQNRVSEMDGDQDPYKGDMGRNWRVLRGGSFSGTRDFASTTSRLDLHPDLRNYDLGFRVMVVRYPSSHHKHVRRDTSAYIAS